MGMLDFVAKQDDKKRSIEDTPEARRQRRLEAMQQYEGMWAGRKDIPQDGVEYQRQLRAEWH